VLYFLSVGCPEAFQAKTLPAESTRLFSGTKAERCRNGTGTMPMFHSQSVPEFHWAQKPAGT
jgi:hypothetical protein